MKLLQSEETIFQWNSDETSKVANKNETLKCNENEDDNHIRGKESPSGSSSEGVGFLSSSPSSSTSENKIGTSSDKLGCKSTGTFKLPGRKRKEKNNNKQTNLVMACTTKKICTVDTIKCHLST